MTMFQFLVTVRTIHFCAVFVLFGSSFFWIYMGPAGAGLPRTHRAIGFMLRIVAPLAALSGMGWLVGTLADMTGSFCNVLNPETLHLFFFDSPFGPVAVVRLTLFAGCLVAAVLPFQNPAWRASLLAIGALLLISQAWLGHAAEGGASLYGALMIFAYSVHMLAAATWVGGLIPLLFALFEERRTSQDVGPDRSLAMLSRYSLTGTLAVSLIVITGAANTAFRVAGPLTKLFATAYGDVLLVKLALVAIMLALAYFNRFIVTPRLRAVPSDAITQLARLRASIGIELGFGMLVIGAAAVLGITPPPH